MDIAGFSMAMFDHQRVREILAPNIQLPLNNNHRGLVPFMLSLGVNVAHTPSCLSCTNMLLCCLRMHVLFFPSFIVDLSSFLFLGELNFVNPCGPTNGCIWVVLLTAQFAKWPCQ